MRKRETQVYYKSSRVSTIIETDVGCLVGDIRIPLKLVKAKKPKFRKIFEETERALRMAQAKVAVFRESLENKE